VGELPNILDIFIDIQDRVMSQILDFATKIKMLNSLSSNEY